MAIENMIQTLKTIEVGTNFKLLAGAWIVFFMPIALELQLLALLILLDLLTGSLVAFRGGYFSAKKLLKTTYKVFLYMILIGSTLMFEQLFTEIYETQLITLFVIGVIAATEFLSIMENLSALGLPIPDIFNTFLKDINHKGLNKVLSDSKAKRRIARNMEILMNKYLMLIHNKDAIRLLEIKFRMWNRQIIEKILNDEIKDINSFMTKYILMVRSVREEFSTVIKQHRNLYDEYQRFGRYSEDQILVLQHQVEQVLLNTKIPMEVKHIKIAEIHMDLLYRTFNEVIVLENNESSRKEYLESN